eukprot:TRINITY_DN12352_c0_g1_i1.p1 TRINITY_DN12352_c0_g1~~TRINITY_DN12352_c0_g1_i1.p1  ORF type:complete len:217 (+),score=53.63 TRINITY_DN12352_c0_g1_i1:190-840(+)
MSVHLLVLGAEASGKSSLLLRFCSEMFLEKHVPTLEDQYRKVIEFEDKTSCVCDILDASSSEQFLFHIPSTDAFILVYNTTSRDSFTQLHSIRETVRQIKDPNEALVILIGTMSDRDEEREVSKEEGERLARDWNCSFFETSARNNWNIDKAFHTIVRQAMEEIAEQTHSPRLKEFKKSNKKLQKSLSDSKKKDNRAMRAEGLRKTRSQGDKCSIM